MVLTHLGIIQFSKALPFAAAKSRILCLKLHLKSVLKKFNFFYFKLIYFFIFSDYFNILMLKIILKNNKKLF